MYQITSICKGGGYHYCRTVPPHPKRNSKGLYPLHRVVAENKLGRSLADNEEVHHVNGDKSDNRPENLQVCTKPEHAAIHGQERFVNRVAHTCPVCERQFLIKPARAGIRKRASQSGLIFCSRSCGAKHQHSTARLECV